MNSPPFEENQAPIPPAPQHDAKAFDQIPTCGLARISLILGIFGLPLLGLLAIPTVICGHVARSKIRKANGALKGDGLARAGLILGYVALALFALGMGSSMAFQRFRYDPTDRIVYNNARQLAAAADQYFLEHNVKSCRSDDLVGPAARIKALYVVAGEKYPETLVAGQPIIVTGVAGARTVTYAP